MHGYLLEKISNPVNALMKKFFPQFGFPTTTNSARSSSASNLQYRLFQTHPTLPLSFLELKMQTSDINMEEYMRMRNKYEIMITTTRRNELWLLIKIQMKRESYINNKRDVTCIYCLRIATQLNNHNWWGVCIMSTNLLNNDLISSKIFNAWSMSAILYYTIQGQCLGWVDITLLCCCISPASTTHEEQQILVVNFQFLFQILYYKIHQLLINSF